MHQAEIVHEARKTIKRMRALARLQRYQLGARELRRITDSLRLAGQHLAGARDAEVRLQTLQRLCAGHPAALELDGIAQLRALLERERDEASTPAHEQEVLHDIGRMRSDLERLSLMENDFDALSPGLRRIYREGRQRYARVKRSRAREEIAMHDWRKRVKSLYYALDMLGCSSLPRTRALTRRADRLGELLGEEHDLWLLATHIDEHPEALGGDDAALRTLRKLVRRRSKRLRKRAVSLGARLYRRKPEAFVAVIAAATPPSTSTGRSGDAHHG